MRAVIIGGGKITDYGYIKKQAETFIGEGDGIIITADSGYDHAVKMGLRVDLAVGDFDSAKKIPPPEIKSVRYRAEKNFTDMELALSHAREAGARNFLLIGATGTRADHTLTNIFMLKDCLTRGEDAGIIDEHNKIKITGTRLEIKGEKGALVSLIPLCDCEGVSTENLDYPLENEILRFGEGRGVSNIMSGEEAAVEVGKGILLVIVARD
ncbi:MAG: thiamine diphosphokinase [Oscillospiraceae bacterium]|nr:thiamine diphosphokinase [Oscillospiraceae bacterium]